MTGEPQLEGPYYQLNPILKAVVVSALLVRLIGASGTT